MNRRSSAISDRRRGGIGESGEAVISFAFIAPMLILLSLGILELSLLMFEHGRASEATRRGARVAAMEPPVADLTNITSGPFVCKSTSGTVTCSSSSVQNGDSFANIVADMQAMLPDLTPGNVVVTYRDSGIGAAATGGFKPFVTVKIVNYDHQFMVMGGFAGLPTQITFDDFQTTQLLNTSDPAAP